ncbi:hypothetical protein PsorP6_016645 [Peronosclerospora sorghi]|uniref:Uncharacterized protein n=1 Tax=Peronosclerospora sorghi TaxID=230839 RepID=A0ACC0VMI4_9STRA|nr:hypothetical protein PsorP6_016645 [Peronosclerospora sorghi]
MNRKIEEAAWIVHKSRNLAHTETEVIEVEMPNQVDRRQEIESQVDMENIEMRHKSASNPSTSMKSVSLPTTGWRCPGIIPDAFYRKNVDLVLAFAKYYVGAYRVNVVRDLRSDRVMLFSHDCENQIVLRDHPDQPDSCDRCFLVWFGDKSFKQSLQRMDRYVLTENILRHAWSLSTEDIAVLSKFKHYSNALLSPEGRKLKEAALSAVEHFKGSAVSSTLRTRSNKRKATADRNAHRASSTASAHESVA